MGLLPHAALRSLGGDTPGTLLILSSRKKGVSPPSDRNVASWRLEFRDLPPVPPQHPESRKGGHRREEEEDRPPDRLHHVPGRGSHEDPPEGGERGQESVLGGRVPVVAKGHQ